MIKFSILSLKQGKSLLINSEKSDVNMDGILCKVCLTNNEEEDNPLVKLCKCSGSMELIHFNCVKMWMNTKLSQKDNEKKTVFSYNMKSFNCEICKTPYPCILFIIKYVLDIKINTFR